MEDLTNSVKDEAKIRIRNLCDHTVCYSITDGPRRELSPNQAIVVSAGELRQLNSEYGGSKLLQNYIQILNPQLAAEFGLEFENNPEYTWTAEDVDKVLLEKPIEVLEDALDFAPAGIIDLIVSRAVALNLPDNNKRDAILNQTGKNITRMIEIKRIVETPSTAAAKTQRKRRVPIDK